MYLFEHTSDGIALVRETKVEKPAEFRQRKEHTLIDMSERRGNKPGESVAVLLDAENLPGRCAVTAILKAQALGLVPLALAFADWTAYVSNRKGSWNEIISRMRIQAIQVSKCRGKRNAVDIAIAAHAMSLHEKDGIKKFFIVSNDGDYLYLVKYLRDKGCMVFGYGTDKANQYLRTAFNQFFCET